MARGRHARRSGLLARLWPGRRRARHVRTDALVAERLAALEAEAVQLRALAHQSAEVAVAALRRASRAEEQAAAVTQEVAGLRADLAVLREELVWTFARGQVEAAPRVVDLRATGTSG